MIVLSEKNIGGSRGLKDEQTRLTVSARMPRGVAAAAVVGPNVVCHIRFGSPIYRFGSHHYTHKRS